jgi:hypothetical protein
MFVHWAKHIRIERLGKRVVSVVCDKCECEYCFPLIRIGTGNSTAPYSIGVGRATRAAEKQAEQDLERRLKTEMELVPCPKCLWVNDELVQGFRQGRHRDLGTASVWFAVLAACALLPALWLFWDDPATLKLLWPLFVGGPLLLGLIALGLLGLRNFLRSRIQPNRRFPDPPELPAGIPTAFIVDPESNELVPATAGRPIKESSNGWLAFRIGHDDLPGECCDCLGDSAAGCGHPVQLTQMLRLEVPRCAPCYGMARGRYWRNSIFAFLVGLALTGAVVALTVGFHEPEVWLVLVGGGVALTLGFSALIASRTTSPIKTRSLDVPRGTLEIRFRNPEYGKLVAEHLRNL